jgi:hypothetical protein
MANQSRRQTDTDLEAVAWLVRVLGWESTDAINAIAHGDKLAKDRLRQRYKDHRPQVKKRAAAADAEYRRLFGDRPSGVRAPSELATPPHARLATALRQEAARIEQLATAILAEPGSKRLCGRAIQILAALRNVTK